MDEAIFERETVDKWFQRRSRRAHRAGHIHLPRAPVIEIVRRANPRQHVAALIVHRDDGNGNIRTQCDRAVARQGFKDLLQAGIQRQRDHGCIFHSGDGLIGGMRRENWHRLAQPRHRRSFRLSSVFFRHAAIFDHAIENAVTRRARDVRIAINATGFRRLRQRHQQRRFCQRQSLRLLAEIGDRGRTDALEIAAEWRQRQIQIENLVLVQLPLDFERAHHLPQLGIHRPLPPWLHQPGQLHRDGGAARDDVTTGDELKRGAAQGQRIDAGMRAKAPVFIGQQQFEVAGIGAGFGIDRQPPAAVGHRVRAQEPAIAVDDRR